MIPFSKLRKILHPKDEAETVDEQPLQIDQTAEMEPVHIDTPAPVMVAPDRPEYSTMPTKATGDTQEMDDDMLSEQLESLRKTLESGAFKSEEESKTVISAAFGNHPPTIEMEQPEISER